MTNKGVTLGGLTIGEMVHEVTAHDDGQLSG
jgi:hypothetical protein